MVEVRLTAVCAIWLENLRDRPGRQRIIARIRRMELGNFGDVKAVGDGISEMRVAFGPGYRVYFVRIGTAIVILLCGGDKASQKRDIVKAKQLAREL